MAFVIRTLINDSNTVLELTETLDLLYFGILHSVEWQCPTDVSGIPIGHIFKGQLASITPRRKPQIRLTGTFCSSQLSSVVPRVDGDGYRLLTNGTTGHINFCLTRIVINSSTHFGIYTTIIRILQRHCVGNDSNCSPYNTHFIIHALCYIKLVLSSLISTFVSYLFGNLFLLNIHMYVYILCVCVCV